MPYLFVHFLRDLVLMQPDLGMCAISFVHLMRDLVLMQPDLGMCAISFVHLMTPAKFCSTNWRCSRTVLEHLELF